MNRLFVFFIVCVLLKLPLQSQHRAFFDYEVLLENIEESLRKGETRSLRDLGTLLDIPDYREDALQLLKENTIFPEDELSLDLNLNKSLFLNFYYKFENEIQFSSTAKVFYVAPLKRKSMDYKTLPSAEKTDMDASTQLRGESTKLLEALSKGDYEKVIKQIRLIAAIDNPEAYAYLRNLTLEKQIQRAKQNYRPQIFTELVKAISEDFRMETLDAILGLVKDEQISPMKAQRHLTALTNVNFSMTDDPTVLSNFYKNLQDSLFTLDEIRQFGYSRYFHFSKDFFPSPVDYYGKILAEVEDLPWVEKMH